MMSLSELWEVVTSETFLKGLSYVGTALGGGMGATVCRWIAGRFSAGEPVERIVRALRGTHEVKNDIVRADVEKDGKKVSTTVTCLKLVGTDICVNENATVPGRWFRTGETPSGVIFHSGEDKSMLYKPHELRRIVRAAKARRDFMNRQDIDAGRKLLAESIPESNPKKG